MAFLSLDEAALARTIELLARRVEIRLPGSGLSRVVRELDGIARRTTETVAFVRRPIPALPESRSGVEPLRGQILNLEYRRVRKRNSRFKI